MKQHIYNTENLFEFAKILGQQTEYKEVLRLVANNSAQFLKADLALIDHSHLFTECSGEGVKYDNYVILIAESKDPRPQLNQECNKISSEQDWAKCAVRETESSVLGYCGVEKCTTSKECDFEINVQEKDKIYLVFRISDAWDYADVQGILSNVQISGLE